MSVIKNRKGRTPAAKAAPRDFLAVPSVPQFTIGRTRVGGSAGLLLIAGPCVIESPSHALKHARRIRDIAARLGMPYIFKSSYDKANRSSMSSFRGLGIDKGLLILRQVREELGVPVLTDVHTVEEVEKAAAVVDVLQIPAFLCRQTDLLLAAGRSGCAVNVKKGQFMAPWEMRNVADKVRSTGNRRVMLTERGTFFGYNTLVNDLRGIPLMKETGCPVIMDATHSVQQPGGRGTSSGGDRRFVPTLAQAGVVAGADGVFMEVHEDPDNAPSDGPNMVPLSKLEPLLARLLALRRAMGLR